MSGALTAPQLLTPPGLWEQAPHQPPHTFQSVLQMHLQCSPPQLHRESTPAARVTPSEADSWLDARHPLLFPHNQTGIVAGPASEQSASASGLTIRGECCGTFLVHLSSYLCMFVLEWVLFPSSRPSWPGRREKKDAEAT
jgi:hypothetical protein